MNFFRKVKVRVFFRYGLIIIIPWIISACTALPKDQLPPPSYAITPDTETIKRKMQEIDTSGCGNDCSGFAVLNRGEEALRWRLVMADSARKTIDAQYYIWHKDASGALLLDRLIRAADRGVRVRLLVDDTQIMDSRKTTAALNLIPNIEVRSFNPFVSKTILGFSRAFEFIIHMDRLNHRMHNKLMVADNAVAIVGGRNIGDEYFGLHHDTNFRDMDLIAVGPIAADVSSSFDLYWNSKWSFAPEAISNEKPNEKEKQKGKKRLRKIIDKNSAPLNALGIEPGNWDNLIAKMHNQLVFSKARVVYDIPPNESSREFTRAAKEISELMRKTKKELLIVSPYFVPTEKGIEEIRELVSRGIKIHILTNSLASNDVVITHSAYKRYRKQLIEAGVELYELRADAKDRDFYSTEPLVSRWLGLHAKVIISDRARVFVGTMNLDPRSAIQNTEIGLIVNSPELAEKLEAVFERDLQPENSWKVKFDEEGRIIWKSSAGIRKTPPAKSFWQRIQDWLLPAALIEEQI